MSNCSDPTNLSPLFSTSLSVQDFLDKAKKEFEENWTQNAKVSRPCLSIGRANTFFACLRPASSRESPLTEPAWEYLGRVPLIVFHMRICFSLAFTWLSPLLLRGGAPPVAQLASEVEESLSKVYLLGFCLCLLLPLLACREKETANLSPLASQGGGLRTSRSRRRYLAVFVRLIVVELGVRLLTRTRSPTCYY